jgi:MFS family permease
VVDLGGGIVADLYESGERTRPMAWYSVGMMLGPILGPVLGGVITGGLGWRWMFWIATMLVSIFCHIILYRCWLIIAQVWLVSWCSALSARADASSPFYKESKDGARDEFYRQIVPRITHC